MTAVATARAGFSGRAEIALQALRTGRRSLVIWSLAFAGLIAMYAVIWPSVKGNADWRDLFDSLPKTYRALFTASGTLDLSTPAGYLGVELMGFMGPALVAVYAISLGSSAVAGEETRGGLEVTLSAPVARGRVLGQRFAALVTSIVALMAAMGVSLWIFSLMLGMDLSLGAIASAATAMGTFGIFIGAVALATGAAAGSPSLARGVAALVAVASYLLNALAQLTSVLEPARPISPYYLVLGNEPLAHGLRVWAVLVVLAVTAALVLAGGAVFARRDVR